MTTTHKLPPKTPSECRGDIVSILDQAKASGITITSEEENVAMTSNDWSLVQPILDKAQGVEK